MKCPKCYGKIDKRLKKCNECGFRLKSIQGATHKDVRRARKEGFGDDVMYTSELPNDISKKKLLLLCIFLGFYGAHSYYAGKFFKAIYSTISMIAVTIFSTIGASGVSLNSDGLGVVGVWVYSISLALMGINLVMFISDIISIATNKYKVSVYKDEFSE